MSDKIEKIDGNKLAARSETFHNYLEQHGLPVDNIIANTKERSIIGSNIENFLSDIPSEVKADARYLSKFICATSIGLFDAALNYVWNEVVLSLRKKASIYGIELFFDAAVGGKRRELYNDEKDLGGLKDQVLLDTCRKLELISDVVYFKLDHILTMRNEVAASHPNVEIIGGYELLGWLQTCVNEVLQERPSESAIRIKSLIDNLKSNTKLLDESTIRNFVRELKQLSPTHVNNLTITLFGIYVSDKTESILRKNISKIVSDVWDLSEDRVKRTIARRIDGYRTNLQNDKLELGIEFLELVGGRRYESYSTRLMELDSLSEDLLEAHSSYDNYYHEPPIMRSILSFIKEPSDIPNEVLDRLTKTVLICRLGRGLTYCRGVSPSGKRLYIEYLNILDDAGIEAAIRTMFDDNVNSRMRNKICQEHLQEVLEIFSNNAISERLKEAIDFLKDDVSKAWNAKSEKQFKELTSTFIDW